MDTKSFPSEGVYRPQSVYRVLMVIETNDEKKILPFIHDINERYRIRNSPFDDIGIRPMCVNDEMDKRLGTEWVDQVPEESHAEISPEEFEYTVLIEEFDPVGLN